MRKKFWAIVVVLSLVCAVAFFRPLSLSKLAGESDRILAVLNEFEIRNGEPEIDSTTYSEIGPKRRRALLALLDRTTYRRTLGSPFSDGAISGDMDKTLAVYFYDDESLVGAFLASSSGEIAVNGKTYRMKDAERFIEQIVEIITSESRPPLPGGEAT